MRPDFSKELKQRSRVIARTAAGGLTIKYRRKLFPVVWWCRAPDVFGRAPWHRVESCRDYDEASWETDCEWHCMTRRSNTHRLTDVQFENSNGQWTSRWTLTYWCYMLLSTACETRTFPNHRVKHPWQHGSIEWPELMRKPTVMVEWTHADFKENLPNQVPSAALEDVRRESWASHVVHHLPNDEMKFQCAEQAEF